MTNPLSYEQALARLEAVGAEAGFGIKPDLSRIRALMEVLDHPESSCPTIHVAGTNGKSSTVRAIATILGAHGIKSGFYTSPHLQSPRERFGLAGLTEEGLVVEMMSREDFAMTLGYLEPFIALVEDKLRDRVTYFETTTAMAFEWMSESAVDVGVLETGMGGRWDATNVILPAVSVLTPIDIDHVDRLGPTPLDGAREKSGIIKPGIPVVCAVQRPEVQEHIAEVAADLDAPVLLEGRDLAVVRRAPAVGGQAVSIRTPFGTYEEIFLSLFGAHQASNVACAIAASESFLGRALDGQVLAAALAELRSPGRMEMVPGKPKFLLDGAHNPHGAAALVAGLRESFQGAPMVVVLAVLRDKDVDGIVGTLSKLGATTIATQLSSDRALPAEELAASPAWTNPPLVNRGLQEALDRAATIAGQDGLVVVTGSLYAVGEARTLLTGPGD